MDAAEARAELARRWLLAYGPATEADTKWWTGWSLGHVRKALAAVAAEEVGLDGGATGYVAPGDLGPDVAAEPWAALLPGLDPSAMAWADRGFHIDAEHRSVLDRSGNIGPTVWWNGRIIGGWAQRPDGEVVWRLLTDAGREATAAVETEASRLAGWVGDARITPRFRTPWNGSCRPGPASGLRPFHVKHLGPNSQNEGRLTAAVRASRPGPLHPAPRRPARRAPG